MQTPSILTRGLGLIGALIVSGTLTVGGALTVGSLSTSGNLAAANVNVTGSATASKVAATKLSIGSTNNTLSFLNSAVASLDFPALSADQCVGRTLTVTGASTSTSAVQTVSVGVLPSIADAATTTAWYGYVSTPNTVTIVGCNGTQPTVDLPATNFRATVSGFTL